MAAQAGVVLVLLGAGLLFLRRADPGMKIPMLVLGTVVLMPGIGFILSGDHVGSGWAPWADSRGPVGRNWRRFA